MVHRDDTAPGDYLRGGGLPPLTLPVIEYMSLPFGCLYSYPSLLCLPVKLGIAMITLFPLPGFARERPQHA